jgi:hypothetical protein
MRFAVAAATLSVFFVLAGDAWQSHRQNDLRLATCDTVGHCATLSAVTPTSGHRENLSEIKNRATPQHQSQALDANGNSAGVVMSRKTNARARVGIAYAARFQTYIDDLESNYGARVLFMGGIRRGRCSVSSEHPCGKALDVCQLRRGVVDPRCKLPSRIMLGQIAAAHGIFEGGRWCNSDYGHAQVGVTASACGDRHARIARQ